VKIRKVLIRNYRNLREILLDNLHDLAVFVEANGSEKSNLMEAIDVFFRGLDSETGQTMDSVVESMLFGQITHGTIDFAFVFELDETELKEILLPEVSERLGLRETNILEISRTINRDSTSLIWRTQDIRVNFVHLIKSGKLVFKGVSSEPEKMIFGGISRSFADKFKLIRNLRTRSQEPEEITEHASFLRERILNQLAKLSLSFSAPESPQSEDIEITARRLCTELSELRFRSEYDYIPKQAQFVPPGDTDANSHHDSGVDELVNLYCQILRTEENGILGIEDPETYLDPDIIRQIIPMLKIFSFHHQLFVTSHSPIFINEANLQDIWILRKERNETHVFKMKESRELRSLLDDFHVRPSDIFMARGLVFVETRTGRKALPIWAEKMGIDFGGLGLSVIPIYGKAIKNYHFPVWINAAEQSGLPYYFVLSKSVAKQESTMRIFRQKLLPQKTLFLFSKPSIEEYFPENRILQALERKYSIKILENEKSLPSPKAKSIEKLLASKGKDPMGWNILIGDLIAKSMSVDEIDDEIKRILLGINKDYTQRLNNQ
jgi:AAA domain, putative AbiEii toxin, Type IV TA system